jgi:hypothetical protein
VAVAVAVAGGRAAAVPIAAGVAGLSGTGACRRQVSRQLPSEQNLGGLVGGFRFQGGGFPGRFSDRVVHVVEDVVVYRLMCGRENH